MYTYIELPSVSVCSSLANVALTFLFICLFLRRNDGSKEDYTISIQHACAQTHMLFSVVLL